MMDSDMVTFCGMLTSTTGKERGNHIGLGIQYLSPKHFKAPSVWKHMQVGYVNKSLPFSGRRGGCIVAVKVNSSVCYSALL